jgi:hypothetical protein
MSTLALRDWEPWRDATPQEWQAANARRPRTPAELPIRTPLPPPLGVWMTGAMQVCSHDEYLPRAHAPWLLPTAVEVWDKEALVWKPDAAALIALAKRSAYSPAGWTDEIDDKTGATGLIRVTFPAGPTIRQYDGSSGAGPLVLTTRLRNAKPTLSVTARQQVDADAEVRILGVNARRFSRAHVHPYIIRTDLTIPSAEPLVIDLQLGAARCSQLLLGIFDGSSGRPQ